MCADARPAGNRAEKGRIATTGSISGILAAANLSAYAMSKHAVEAFTDSLAAEMAPLGVHVSVIEPGSYKTHIFKNAVERLGNQYADRADMSRFEEPDDVAAAFVLALSDRARSERSLAHPSLPLQR